LTLSRYESFRRIRSRLRLSNTAACSSSARAVWYWRVRRKAVPTVSVDDFSIPKSEPRDQTLNRYKTLGQYLRDATKAAEQLVEDGTEVFYNREG